MDIEKINTEVTGQEPDIKGMAQNCWELARTRFWPEKKFTVKANKRLIHNLFFYLAIQPDIEAAYCNFCNHIEGLAAEENIDLPKAEPALTKDDLLMLVFGMFIEGFDKIEERLYFREGLMEMMNTAHSTLLFHWEGWQRKYNRSYKRMLKRRHIELLLEMKRAEIRKARREIRKILGKR